MLTIVSRAKVVRRNAQHIVSAHENIQQHLQYHIHSSNKLSRKCGSHHLIQSFKKASMSNLSTRKRNMTTRLITYIYSHFPCWAH